MEKQRRRDLSFAASVQQPFVAGRGEKFAFFRHLFFSPSPKRARSSISSSPATFRGFFRGSFGIFASYPSRHPSLPRKSRTILIESPSDKLYRLVLFTCGSNWFLFFGSNPNPSSSSTRSQFSFNDAD